MYQFDLRFREGNNKNNFDHKMADNVDQMRSSSNDVAASELPTDSRNALITPEGALNLSFGQQLDILKREREMAMISISVLEHIENRGSDGLENSRINLMTAINNQKKANISLRTVVRKIYQHSRNRSNVATSRTSNRRNNERGSREIRRTPNNARVQQEQRQENESPSELERTDNLIVLEGLPVIEIN